MTQAISLQNMLIDQGAEVCEILVGQSSSRTIPEFLYKQAKAPVSAFESPNFITDKKGKSIRILPSVTRNLMRLPVYTKSMKMIHAKVKEHEPDMIINFYDPLAGLFNLFHNQKVPMACIAHQYIYHHPGFEFPSRNFANITALKVYTYLTSIGAVKKFALSFYPINTNYRRSIVGTPPLLRKTLFDYTPSDGDYLLVYLVNKGYAEDVIEWHKKNPSVELHCFTDDKQVKGELKYDNTLCFHSLDDKKFLEKMAGARGLVSTAGFESVCEAMYLGKPALMIPVQGHFEQYCNARDAFKAGAGIYDDAFRIGRLLDYLPRYKQSTTFRHWVQDGPSIILGELNAILAARAAAVMEPAMA